MPYTGKFSKITVYLKNIPRAKLHQTVGAKLVHTFKNVTEAEMNSQLKDVLYQLNVDIHEPKKYIANIEKRY